MKTTKQDDDKFQCKITHQSEWIFDDLPCNKNSITEKMTLREIEEYVNKIVSSKIFRTSFAGSYWMQNIKVRGTNKKNCLAYVNVKHKTIYLTRPVGARKITTVLHELAHIITDTTLDEVSHGPFFRTTYIKLVKYFHPDDNAHLRLEYLFETHEKMLNHLHEK